MDASKPANTPAVQQSEKLVVSKERSGKCDRQLYQEIVGCLLFLETRTRPDIYVAVNLLCRQVSDPQENDLVAAKRVLRYLKGTEDFILNLSSLASDGLVAFSDSDWGGDKTYRKSTSGVLLSFNGAPVLWRTTKQSCVALSASEAEFMALSEASQCII